MRLGSRLGLLRLDVCVFFRPFFIPVCIADEGTGGVMWIHGYDVTIHRASLETGRMVGTSRPPFGRKTRARCVALFFLSNIFYYFYGLEVEIAGNGVYAYGVWALG